MKIHSTVVSMIITCDNIPDCIDGSDEDTQYCG